MAPLPLRPLPSIPLELVSRFAGRWTSNLLFLPSSDSTSMKPRGRQSYALLAYLTRDRPCRVTR